MFTNRYLKKLYLSLVAILIAVSFGCQAQGQQRNTIYVLDCTGSMGGFNGVPNIWKPTKDFLKAELEKEAKENPGSKVTILPFQQKVLHPINVDLNSIAWPNLENVLDDYLDQLTATNICDAWLEAEKYIDRSCDNYIVLMTDGHDNIGGSANESNRMALLSQILRNFCGKYQNTNGFYVELTAAATLPADIKKTIENCSNLYKIDAIGGIPRFGCFSDDVISLNTRDLPTYITLGFSNSGTFVAAFNNAENPYVRFSIKDNKISQGKVVIHVESKFDDDIEALNKAIGASSVDLPINFLSDEVNITNSELNVVLHTTPLRSLDFAVSEKGKMLSQIERIKSFLWIKGNLLDTLRWDLDPVFSAEAISDNSLSMFRLRADKGLSRFAILFDGKALPNDSIIIIRPKQKALIEVVVPQNEKDNEFNLTLNEICSKKLDRLNGVRPNFDNGTIFLYGNVKTKISITEIICWCILGIIILFLLVWFGFIRNQKYPKFKNGIITIQSPYFATIRINKCRLIVMGPKAHNQDLFDKIWKGKILYHTNSVWPCDVEISPSGKNMRFRCPSGMLICDPAPLLMRGSTYKIINTNDSSSKLEININ